MSKSCSPQDRARSHRRFRLLAIAALAVAAVVLAGCGSDDDTTTDTADTEPTVLSVTEAIEVSDDALHQVTGFVVTIDEHLWLCTALAESDPPQCGRPGIALAGDSTSNPNELFGDDLVTKSNVSWTDNPVTVTGTIIESDSGPELRLTN